MASGVTRGIAIALVAAFVLVARAPAGRAADGPLLPDLDQETPGQLMVAPTGKPGHQRWWLGFSSAVSNVGFGPLTIVGHRPDATTPAMVADQVVAGATPETVLGVGELRYVHSQTHQHWH